MSLLDQLANFVRDTTTASVDSTQTTIPVSNASLFPDPATGNDPYNVVVWDVDAHPRPDQDADVEVLRVTGRDTGTNDLTVTRGQEGTTGASHPSGSAIHLARTSKWTSDARDALMTVAEPSAALDGGESLELAVRVPDGSTLEVYRWGAFQVSDGTAPTGLDCELLDGADTVQASENTANTESDAAPVASYTNSSGSVSVFKLRALNGTGGTIGSPGVSFRAVWRVI